MLVCFEKLTSLTIDLGGDAGDKLIINANNGDVTLAHTTTGNGTITVNALTLPFTGVGTDTVSIENSDDLTITLPATADNFVFTAHSSTGYSQLVGTALTKTLFTNPASSLTINLANDTNTLTINSLDADFNPTGGVTINGGSQSDAFSITSLGSAFTRSLNVLGNRRHRLCHLHRLADHLAAQCADRKHDSAGNGNHHDWREHDLQWQRNPQQWPVHV
jgi:hypothetical protein